MLVLRLVLAHTVLRYRFGFAPGEDGTAIHSKARNNIIIKAGPLQLVFEERLRQSYHVARETEAELLDVKSHCVELECGYA